MKNLRTDALKRRLAAWRKRLADAKSAGDDSAYIAVCRAKIEELEDALAGGSP